MEIASLPDNERQRLAALHRYGILDTPPEDAFDELARLASMICATPIALITLVDETRQWFKARVGVSVRELSREIAVCAHTILGNDLLIIPDALEDPRFADNPLVVNTKLRFYAGVPLTTADGVNLGTLCVMDHQPRTLDDAQKSALRALARQAVGQLELRKQISERASAEEALRKTEDRIATILDEVEQMKKEFVASVSHELRTPLTSIRGSLGLLASGMVGELNEEATRVVGVAERNSIRLMTLINDLLDFEKLDNGKVQMNIRPIALRPVVEQAVDAVRSVAAHDRIRVELNVTDAMIFGDGSRLAQVIVNLLTNAVKYSHRGGVVTVTVQPASSWVEVRVRDRGVGIPAQAQKKLFQHFSQIDASDSRAKPGTGLGLAICTAIIEQHGGEIGVESVVGEGSTFWFRVRAASETAERRPVLPDLDVLLLDDDAALLESLTAQLAAAGVPVRVARSGEAGLAAVAEKAPGLIVLDLQLPDIDGFKVVSRLRNDPRRCDVPLLVYSTNELTTAERNRLQLGPTRFLKKSRANDAEFRAAVGQLLDYSRGRELT
jgi:signal transduction histidine kinase